MKPIVLSAEPLILRPLRMTDASELVQVVRSSANSLKPFLYWASGSYDLEMARSFIRLAREGRERGSDLHLGIFDKSSEEFLGMVGLMRMKAATLGFEIGYWLREDRQGSGHMTTATRALIAHAFGDLKAHRVWLNCDVKNHASRRVAEKLGMRREGRVKAFLLDTEGRPRDHYLFGLLKREFET